MREGAENPLRRRAERTLSAGERASRRLREDTQPKRQKDANAVLPKRTCNQRARSGTKSSRAQDISEKTAEQKPPRAQPEQDAKVVWTDIGRRPPSSGRELTNPKLAFVLNRGAKTISRADLAAFAVGEVQPTDFIKAGTTYFQPAGAAPGSPLRMHRRAAARCRWGATSPRVGLEECDAKPFGVNDDEREALPTGVGEDVGSPRSADGGMWLGSWWMLSA